MTVRSRSINPVTGVVIGGAVIVVLIVAALHPPGRGTERRPSASGGPTGPVCPDPTVAGNGDPAATADPASCWLMPVDPATAEAPADEPASDEPTTDEIAHTVRPVPSTAPTDDHEPDDDPGADENDDAPTVATVNCPGVKSHLSRVPAAAASEVTANLAELRRQITDADARLAELAADPVDDPNYVRNTVLGPLKDRRIATLDRITIAIGRVTTPPSDLAALAPCTLRT